MNSVRAAYVAGLVNGAALWAFGSFATFHLLRGFGVIEEEVAWGIVQSMAAILIAIGAVVINSLLGRSKARQRKRAAAREAAKALSDPSRLLLGRGERHRETA